MASYPLEVVGGIGDVDRGKLAAAGIKTTGALLVQAATPQGRKALAGASGIDEARILRFANLADLMRVRGVAIHYSELLEAAGVDTVKELRGRKPEHLKARLAEVNGEKKLVRSAPSLSEVSKWIAAAKTMKTVLRY